MNFEIFKSYPPDREAPVAEVTIRHDGFVDIPAEVYIRDGALTITIFAREGGPCWEYPLADWIEALQRAAEAVADGTR